MSEGEEEASQTRSQADLKFPKTFEDKKYLTTQLKKDELISRLQVQPRVAPANCA
jgi:hypothetical protein